MKFEVEFSPEATDHFAAMRKFDQARLVDAVEKQLRHQPLSQTRNRKPLRSNLIATWELRVQELRVYYDVDDERGVVLIRAIGMKAGNRVSIGGVETDAL